MPNFLLLVQLWRVNRRRILAGPMHSNGGDGTNEVHKLFVRRPLSY